MKGNSWAKPQNLAVHDEDHCLSSIWISGNKIFCCWVIMKMQLHKLVITIYTITNTPVYPVYQTCHRHPEKLIEHYEHIFITSTFFCQLVSSRKTLSRTTLPLSFVNCGTYLNWTDIRYWAISPEMLMFKTSKPRKQKKKQWEQFYATVISLIKKNFGANNIVTFLSGCAEHFQHDLKDVVDTYIFVRNWFASHERTFNLQHCFPFPIEFYDFIWWRTKPWLILICSSFKSQIPASLTILLHLFFSPKKLFR